MCVFDSSCCVIVARQILHPRNFVDDKMHKRPSAGNGGARNFTPADAQELFLAANLSLAAQLFPQFSGNITPDNTVPSTHFYGFYGSGVPFLSQSSLSTDLLGAGLVISS